MTRTLITVGIDAANLRRGGGITHLAELLAATEPEQHGIQQVIVWTGRKTMERLPQRSWLKVICPPALDGGLLRRTYWQWMQLGREAKHHGCDVIFAPGGSYSAHFSPAVTMSQNLLPFELRELGRYGTSAMALKLCLLRLIQSRSFRRTQGVIFLTDYAQCAVQKVTGQLKAQTARIPHGIAPRFLIPPRPSAARSRPIRAVYVSIVDMYKHQWHVVSAIELLRKQGHDIRLDLIGPAHGPALSRLNNTLKNLPEDSSWVRYLGEMPYTSVHEAYQDADLAIFASSCENQPIILLEMMAAGLPVACSNRGPMPEILQNAGRYFDPENPQEIAEAVREIVVSRTLQQQLAQQSYDIAQSYSWVRTAAATFSFLREVAVRHSGTNRGRT